MKLLKNSNALILSHFSIRTIEGGGPPQEIRDYLLPKTKRLYYIEHPFPYAKDHRSSMIIYEEGILKKQIYSFKNFGPEGLFYILDIFITFYFLIRAWTRFDLCIALDNLNTVSVLPFKKLGIVRKLIFYTIDYTPNRFKNKILNNIYHLIDRIACYNSDVIWILSERMVIARKENKVSPKKSAKSILLPMGANLSRINVLPIEKINRYDIVFAGILLEKQGIQLILKSLPKIISKIPKVRFIIIGQGAYEQTLKKLASSLNINNHVIFEGFVKDHKDVENILSRSAIGVAPYIPSSDNYTFYTDPGKPKLYLGCGLPVVITDVPAIARIIEAKKAGLIADYSPKSFVLALVKLLSNDMLYEEYRNNAISLSKKYNTNSLISEALDKTN